MNKKRLSGVAFAMLCVYAASSWSVMLDIRLGTLYGAQEVQVGNTLYDVSFQDGTCIGLYGNCDEVSDFPFATLAEAQDANLSLLDQVFVDTLDGLFDSEPLVTFGCENAGNECVVQTPIGSQDPNLPFGANDPAGTYAVSTLFNHQTESRDTHTGFGQGVRAATTVSPFNRPVITDSVFAIWSLNGGGTNPVPIPGTLYLILTGLLALTFRHYQRY